MNFRSIALIAAALTTAAAPPLLSGCAAVAVAAVAGTALVVADRRSAGAQLDDEAIELKIGTEWRQRWGDRAHVNGTSYNGIVLLTGEVPDATAKAQLTDLAKAVPRVRSVQGPRIAYPSSRSPARLAGPRDSSS